MFKKLILASSALGALSVAGCTTAQEQQVLSDINTACIALPIGTAIAVEIASSLVGGAGAVTIANVIQAGVISQINTSGGTATVKVSTGNPGGRMTRRGTLVFRPGAAVYVVPPL
jgi:hypothetical protein